MATPIYGGGPLLTDFANNAVRMQQLGDVAETNRQRNVAAFAQNLAQNLIQREGLKRQSASDQQRNFLNLLNLQRQSELDRESRSEQSRQFNEALKAQTSSHQAALVNALDVAKLQFSRMDPRYAAELLGLRSDMATENARSSAVASRANTLRAQANMTKQTGLANALKSYRGWFGSDKKLALERDRIQSEYLAELGKIFAALGPESSLVRYNPETDEFEAIAVSGPGMRDESPLPAAAMPSEPRSAIEPTAPFMLFSPETRRPLSTLEIGP